jgi:hypothetical protein
MGYYTNYQLEATGFRDLAENECCQAKLVNIAGYSGWDRQSGSDNFFVSTLYEVKWYDHERDMIELSLLFPAATFDLHGQGEESNDQWHLRIRNGATERVTAQIVFPEFKNLT